MELGEIDILEATVITKQGPHHSGPGSGEHQIAFAGALDLLAVLVENSRFYAEERKTLAKKSEVTAWNLKIIRLNIFKLLIHNEYSRF